MGAALCVNATLAQYYIHTDDDETAAKHSGNALRASVAMNFVFSVFFTSLGCLSWIYSSEVFPTAMRARGTSLSTFTNWAANLVFAQCSPIALTRMGYRYFYVFMAFNWSAAATVFFFYPETQGYTLEGTNDLFGDLVATPPQQEVHRDDDDRSRGGDADRAPVEQRESITAGMSEKQA